MESGETALIGKEFKNSRGVLPGIGDDFLRQGPKTRGQFGEKPDEDAGRLPKDSENSESESGYHV